MVIRELVTKLSYAIDNSGLKEYGNNALQASKQALSKVSETANKRKEEIALAKQLKAQQRELVASEKARFSVLNAQIANSHRAEKSRIAEIKQAQKDKFALINAQIKQTRQNQRNADKEARDNARNRNKATESLGRYSNYAANAGAVVGGVITGTVGAMMAKGVSGLMELRRTQAGLGGLLGGREKGNELQRRTEKFAVETPLESPEINRATNMLIAQGVASEDVIGKMRMLGDVALGNGEIFDRLTNQYVQAMGKGAPQWDELKRFGEAGVPILKEMGKKYGLTQAELMKMSKDRKITFKMFDDTLQQMTTTGSFKDAMKLQMGEVGGLWTRLVDEVGLLLRGAMEGIEKPIQSVLSVLGTVVGFLRKIPKVVLGLTMLGTLLGGLTLLIGAFGAKILTGVIASILAVRELMEIKAILIASGGKLGEVGGLMKGVRGWFGRIGAIVIRFVPPLLAIASVVLAIWGIMVGLKKLFGSKDETYTPIENKNGAYNLGPNGELIRRSNFSQYEAMTVKKQQPVQVNHKSEIRVDLTVPEGVTALQKKSMHEVAKSAFDERFQRAMNGVQFNTVGVR